jgi:RNA polymerase sigma factor (sigma-70 family)
MSQKLAAQRYKGVNVMSMANRWAEAEFEAIFRGHYERIVRTARCVLRSDAEAEEVCAEVFLRLYRSGPDVLDGGIVGGWLYRAATRAAIDILRKNKRRGAEEEIDSANGAVTENHSDDPLNRLLRGERIAEVQSVLARLKVEKAQMLLLRHGGLSYREIAEAMQINANSVGTMLARAEAEFCALYQRHQWQSKSAACLETAKEG